MRDQFREICLSAMDPGGPKAVERLAKAAIEQGMAAEDVEYVQEVIAQLREPTPEELQRLRTKYPECPLLTIFGDETDTNMLSLLRLKNS